MKKSTEVHLRRVLERLERTTEKLMATRGYTQEGARVRLLQELIKEQIHHADTGPTARALW